MSAFRVIREKLDHRATEDKREARSDSASTVHIQPGVENFLFFIIMHVSVNREIKESEALLVSLVTQ